MTALTADDPMFADLTTAEKLALHRVLNSAGVSLLRRTRLPAFTGLHGELQAARWPLRHDLKTELPHYMYAACGGADLDMYAPHGITELQRRPAVPDCYRCGLAAARHPAGLPCPAPDDFWNCPEHRTELLYVNEPDVPLEEHYQCPAPGCTHGRWVS